MSEGRWPVGWPELVAPFPYFGGKRRAAPIIVRASWPSCDQVRGRGA